MPVRLHRLPRESHPCLERRSKFPLRTLSGALASLDQSIVSILGATPCVAVAKQPLWSSPRSAGSRANPKRGPDQSAYSRWDPLSLSLPIFYLENRLIRLLSAISSVPWVRRHHERAFPSGCSPVQRRSSVRDRPRSLRSVAYQQIGSPDRGNFHHHGHQPVWNLLSHPVQTAKNTPQSCPNRRL